MKKGLLKKLFATILVGAMAISMVACGGEDADEKDALTKIKEKGELTVGMSVDYAPYEFFVMENGKKKMVGMDLEILKEVAKDIGVDFKVEEMEFKGICTAVNAGQVDIGLSGLSPDEKRKEIMPIANKYTISELLEACRYYLNKTKRRITFEYALVKDVNDGMEDAKALGKLLSGMLCHVNLIPVNEIKENSFKRSSKKAIDDFSEILRNNGIEVTTRREMGSDINAACGQLRRSYIETQKIGGE